VVAAAVATTLMTTTNWRRQHITDAAAAGAVLAAQLWFRRDWPGVLVRRVLAVGVLVRRVQTGDSAVLKHRLPGLVSL
jgi:hypothetical protein